MDQGGSGDPSPKETPLVALERERVSADGAFAAIVRDDEQYCVLVSIVLLESARQIADGFIQHYV